MWRIGKFHYIVASTVSASINTFTPRRLLAATWVAEPIDLGRRVAALQTTVVSTGRDLLRAAEQIPNLVADTQAILDAFRLLLHRIDTISAHAAVTLDSADVTCTDAAASVRGVQQLEKQVTVLLDRCEPLLGAVTAIDPALVRATNDLVARLQPLLTAVTAVDAEAPAQAAALLSRSGPLLDQIDATLMPLLGELHDAVPDVRGILPVVRRLEPVMVDVETRIAGLPGAARLRRRGQVVIDEAMSDDDDDDQV